MLKRAVWESGCSWLELSIGCAVIGWIPRWLLAGRRDKDPSPPGTYAPSLDDIYRCLPSGRIWCKVFFIVGVLGKGDSLWRNCCVKLLAGPGEQCRIIIETFNTGGSRPQLATLLLRHIELVHQVILYASASLTFDNGRLSKGSVYSQEKTFWACQHLGERAIGRFPYNSSAYFSRSEWPT